MEMNETFKLKKALVLTKFSRLEYEKRKHPEMSEGELHDNVRIFHANTSIIHLFFSYS